MWCQEQQPWRQKWHPVCVCEMELVAVVVVTQFSTHQGQLMGRGGGEIIADFCCPSPAIIIISFLVFCPGADGKEKTKRVAARGHRRRHAKAWLREDVGGVFVASKGKYYSIREQPFCRKNVVDSETKGDIFLHGRGRTGWMTNCQRFITIRRSIIPPPKIYSAAAGRNETRWLLTGFLYGGKIVIYYYYYYYCHSWPTPIDLLLLLLPVPSSQQLLKLQRLSCAN